MGLKYSLFMIKVGSNDMLKKLIDAGLTDQTELMKKDVEFEKNQIESFSKIASDKTIDATEKVKKINEMISAGPEDKDLKAFKERNEDPALKDIFIWWKTLKGTPFVFGGFTTYLMERRLFQAYVSMLFMKAKLEEWAFVDYVHTMNEGNVLFVKMAEKDIDLKNFDLAEKEHEHYERYIKRVSKKIDYPIVKMHDEMLKHLAVRWDHCVVYKIEAKKKQEVQQNEKRKEK